MNQKYKKHAKAALAVCAVLLGAYGAEECTPLRAAVGAAIQSLDTVDTPPSGASAQESEP